MATYARSVSSSRPTSEMDNFNRDRPDPFRFYCLRWQERLFKGRDLLFSFGPFVGEIRDNCSNLYFGSRALCIFDRLNWVVKCKTNVLSCMCVPINMTEKCDVRINNKSCDNNYIKRIQYFVHQLKYCIYE